MLPLLNEVGKTKHVIHNKEKTCCLAIVSLVIAHQQLQTTPVPLPLINRIMLLTFIILLE